MRWQALSSMKGHRNLKLSQRVCNWCYISISEVHIKYCRSNDVGLHQAERGASAPNGSNDMPPGTLENWSSIAMSGSSSTMRMGA
jgi:hypothetical protein